MLRRINSVRLLQEMEPGFVIASEQAANVVLEGVKAYHRKSLGKILLRACCETRIVRGEQTPSQTCLHIDQVWQSAAGFQARRQLQLVHLQNLASSGQLISRDTEGAHHCPVHTQGLSYFVSAGESERRAGWHIKLFVGGVALIPI